MFILLFLPSLKGQWVLLSCLDSGGHKSTLRIRKACKWSAKAIRFSNSNTGGIICMLLDNILCMTQSLNPLALSLARHCSQYSIQFNCARYCWTFTYCQQCSIYLRYEFLRIWHKALKYYTNEWINEWIPIYIIGYMIHFQRDMKSRKAGKEQIWKTTNASRKA